MLKLLHRQVLKELFSVFGLTVGCLLGLIVIGRLLQLRDILLGQSLNVLDLGLIFFYLTPFFLLQIMPIACMLAVFLTFLRMSTDKELVALKAGGVSLGQMLPGPLVFCLLSTALAFVCSLHGVSWGMENFRHTLLDLVQSRTKLALQAGVFNQEFSGFTFYAQQVDNETGQLKFVFVEDTSQKDITVTIVAPEAQVGSDPEEGRLQILFKNGRIFRTQGEKLDILHFGSYAIKLPLASLLSGFRIEEIKPSGMSFAKLLELRGLPPDSPVFSRFPRGKLAVEIQKRLALPVACLVLGLFAMPIACVFRGLRQQYGLVLSLGLFLVYYSLLSLGISLGEAGSVSPVQALWGPNVLFLAVGAVFFRMAQRERGPQVFEWLAHLRARRKPA